MPAVDIAITEVLFDVVLVGLPLLALRLLLCKPNFELIILFIVVVVKVEHWLH